MKKTFKSYLALVCLCLLSMQLYSQKRLVDNFAHQAWPELKSFGYDSISVASPNGRYFFYRYGLHKGIDTLVLADINGTQLLKRPVMPFSEIKDVRFSSRNEVAIFKFGEDSLEVYDLKKNKSRFKLKGIASFQLLEAKRCSFLVVKQFPEAALAIYSVNGVKLKSYPGYWDPVVSRDKEVICIKSSEKILFIKVADLTEKVVFKGKVTSMDMDPVTKDITFLSENGEGKWWAICYYEYNANRLSEIISSAQGLLSSEYTVVASDIVVLKDKTGVVFRIQKKDSKEQVPAIKGKDWQVWSYLDNEINGFKEDTIWTCFYDVGAKKLRKLFNNTESPLGSLKSMADRGLIVTQTILNGNEYFWNNQRSSAFVYDLSSQERSEINTMDKSLTAGYYQYSPGGKYVYWWDPLKLQYFSYEIASRQKRELTPSRDIRFYDSESEILDRKYQYNAAGWTLDDRYLLIYDEFDIWRIDPQGKEPMRNLTGGQGARKQTRIRLMPGKTSLGGDVLLSLYDVSTKDNGLMIWNIKTSFRFPAAKLGPYVYLDNRSSNALRFEERSYVPIRLANGPFYIVRRESSGQSANLFLTKDFINYKPLTSIYPERSYQWYKTKLIEWDGVSAKKNKGILYYPENFDEKKKYPVIMHYYESRSDELNIFKLPLLSDGEISIPWYTSNGYCVFVPDMHYETANNRVALKRTITGALNELAKVSWLDTANVGIQGHSFGGYETFMLVTSMHFKAAQASSGISNFSSYFSHLLSTGGTRQSHMELDQGNAGSPPWENKQVYIDSSPIHFANMVSTPLLIMHGKVDNNVPIVQSYEMFAALRRLNKPTWLLTYLKEHHNLGEEAQLDFTVKQQEFFGHFLKGEKRPDWLI